jgi:hypothetical protein
MSVKTERGATPSCSSVAHQRQSTSQRLRERLGIESYESIANPHVCNAKSLVAGVDG